MTAVAIPEITPLSLARLQLPDGHPEGPGACTVFGFLVRDGEHCILVDTGVGSGSELIDRSYQPEHSELSVALAGAGASVEEITAVVNSHLHFDHCGNNRAFPGVPIYVQRAELEAARAPHYTVPDWVDYPGAHYVEVEGRHSISPHLELLPTPGHTPGHQSLLVRRSRGVALIVAQAAYSADEFQRFLAGPFEVGEEHGSESAYQRSLGVLRDLGPSHAYFSHDVRVWAP